MLILIKTSATQTSTSPQKTCDILNIEIGWGEFPFFHMHIFATISNLDNIYEKLKKKTIFSKFSHFPLCALKIAGNAIFAIENHREIHHFRAF